MHEENPMDQGNGFVCLYHEISKHVDCNGTFYREPELDDHLNSSMPHFWMYIAIYVFLVIVCGIMQGLVLAVVSLDLTDLKVMYQAGNEKTRKYAKRFIPFAKRHHLILVTLIVVNAICAEAMPIFFERLSNPLTAILVSATAFLIFGEILPQSICSKYGLQIGYYLAWLIWLLTGLFIWISYPVAKILDWMLGKGSGTFHSRKELCALVDMHGPVIASEEGGITCGRNKRASVPLERLSADEVLVIKGALAMGQKTARQVMVKLDDVYMLPSDAVLDESLVQEIFNVGHSRIPVYESHRENVIGVFLTKRLILIDPKEGLSIGTIFHGQDSARALYPPYLVDENKPLYDLLNEFQTGTATHMAFITRTTTALDRKIIGIVTLEDLIEELLQEEIRDESDLLRQWRLQVAKVKVVHRLTKGLERNQEKSAHRQRFLSVPSLNESDDGASSVRKSSLSYIS